MVNTIIEQLKAEIKGIPTDPKFENFGTVVSTADNIAEIRGLSKAMYSEKLIFETPSGEIPGIALNLEENSVKAVILGESRKISEGISVKSTGQIFSIAVSEKLLGRVINPLGEAKDGKTKIDQHGAKNYPLEKIAPGVITRKSVKTPFHTGTKAIDAMIPIGRGQRELIIGDRQTGKTTLAINAIINQKKDNQRRQVICIYVAIGQKESKVAQITEKLQKEGAMSYTIIVSASASEPASLAFLAPYAGAAIGEYFMDKGMDAVVIYDDLSKHAAAYRELSLLLRRPPGREAYPGDIFYLHSRLLERAANLAPEHGGGSLTALPIIETQLGDVSAYIPTNVISITDGQIYLEPELFHQGIRPAINVGLSVSRVGSSAQTKAMKKVAGKMRLELAQYRELAAFSQFGSELDPTTKERLARGERLTEILKQDEHTTIPFEEQVAVIYAVVNGLLDEIAVSKIKAFEKELIKFLKDRHNQILTAIRQSGELAEQTEAALKDAIKDFRDNYFEK
jgi:F-type H+-transporting ATPase subunit alpha